MPLNIPDCVTTPEMKPYMPGQEDNVGSNRVHMKIPKTIPPMRVKMMPIPGVIPPMQVCAEVNEENLEP